MSHAARATASPDQASGAHAGAAASSAAHLLSLQQPSGCWEGEMVWCTMILSQQVIVQTVCGRTFDDDARAAILRHYEVTRDANGAWGLHPESGGFVFTTTLAYVALRLLGVPADAPLCKDALCWLRAQERGVLAIPTWGKYWLAFLDLYPYEAVNACPPELYALPSWIPIHPSNYYCHTRNIYLGLAYLYGRRFRARLALRDTLRDELYGAPYEAIDFAAHRHDVAATDLYIPVGPILRQVQNAMYVHERVHIAGIRERALAHCLERIVYEQRQSRYQGLSPVNGLLNCLALHAADPAHPDLAPSLDGVEAWRWEDAAEGRRYCGARSQTWDTAFAIQALCAGPSLPEGAREAIARAYRYLLGAQMTEELPDWRGEDRDPALGGWCFSDGRHRWPVSDCTAEAVTAIARAHHLDIDVGPRISDERLAQAAEFMLYRQNPDGGFGTYERRRGALWLEGVNNTEMYGSCMTERSYLECTASSVAALVELRAALPPLAADARVARAIERGVAFLRSRQRADGSWPGFWGVNFTYAIFHVVRALRVAGAAADDPAVERAGAWLVAHQKADGGFGEHWSSCLDERYLEHPRSQAVMTSWALLALVELRPAHPRSGRAAMPIEQAIERAAAWLCEHQRGDGSYPSEAVNGVFFGSAMLDYRLYKSYFPAWALARTLA